MLLPLLPRPIGFPVPDLKFNHSNLVLEGAYLFLSVALIYFSFPIILLDMSFILSSLNISLGISTPGPMNSSPPTALGAS